METNHNQNFFIPLFRLPFRPFFLAAGAFSALIIAIWGLHWNGSLEFKPQGGILWWHGHEMLFGFSGAVLVGFLLTAAKNWTGLPGMGGWPLIALFSFWLIARICLLFSGNYALTLAYVFESAFWVYACLTYSQMIIKRRLWANAPFSLVLAGLGLLSILSIRSTQIGGEIIGYLHNAVMFFILVITVIGGRIIPFFTASATSTEKVEPNKLVEILTILLSVKLLVWSIIWGLSEPNYWLGYSVALLVLMQLVRFSRWPVRLSIANPMLWSLYLGYCCLILGLALLACYHFSIIVNLSAAIHAITLGAIGLMILTMMSRVSMGHTGRAIVASKFLVFAFILLIISVLLRVVIPLMGLGDYLIISYVTSACFWVLAFLIWTVSFLPILTQTRADGRPG
ncbi:NnrS family protein [Aliikangiella sp. IMCC44359]|uniref:NnrS family protein n=1 Tax=Aliikangiella sp. IMCC44359 TaxID=3459125 RepID=UPI00403A80B3